jgi:hypothetical protein
MFDQMPSICTKMEVFGMTAEQFQREIRYCAATALAGEMRCRGLISLEEYAKFDTQMHQKHRPLIGRTSPLYDRCNR